MEEEERERKGEKAEVEPGATRPERICGRDGAEEGA